MLISRVPVESVWPSTRMFVSGYLLRIAASLVRFSWLAARRSDLLTSNMRPESKVILMPSPTRSTLAPFEVAAHLGGLLVHVAADEGPGGPAHGGPGDGPEEGVAGDRADGRRPTAPPAAAPMMAPLAVLFMPAQLKLNMTRQMARIPDKRSVSWRPPVP